MADINSKNKMRSARTEKLIGGDNINKKGETGVYGANPAPAFSNYHQSTGKDTIPLKFAESLPDSINKKENVLRGAKGQGTQKKAAIPTSSTIMKTPNRYRSAMTQKGTPKIGGK